MLGRPCPNSRFTLTDLRMRFFLRSGKISWTKRSNRFWKRFKRLPLGETHWFCRITPTTMPIGLAFRTTFKSVCPTFGRRLSLPLGNGHRNWFDASPTACLPFEKAPRGLFWCTSLPTNGTLGFTPRAQESRHSNIGWTVGNILKEPCNFRTTRPCPWN